MVTSLDAPAGKQLSIDAIAEDWPEDPIVGEGHPGQWRLARIDVANWGTFNGYHSLAVDRKGLLVTGASGSGKTSLLDAVTMVLAPPRNRHLNAAARDASSKGEDRTPVSYIRGAWRHEADDTGEITSSYLRKNTATWSGIMLRYENGLHDAQAGGKRAARPSEPINLIALFNLKAGSNSSEGITQLFAIARGDRTLDEFERFAINGIDSKKLRSELGDSGQTFREHPAFAASFCRQLGIAGPKTLELLHKTQAAKNFGSLDDLFRNFMLDEPKTFEQAREAVEQFTALSQAHSGVVDQRRQMEHLAPLIALDEQNAAAQHSIEALEKLGECLPGFLEQLALNMLNGERERVQLESDRLAEEQRQAKTEQRFAHQAFEQAQKALADVGGDALDLAESQMLEYERQLKQVKDNRSRLLHDLSCAGVEDLPKAYAEWQKLGREIEAQADAATAEQARDRDERYRSYGRVPELKSRIAAAEDELRHLRSRGTNIPKCLHQVRMDIAAHLGVSPGDLPFVGELVCVDDEFAPWRGAIERLLENRAKTLLVAARHIRTVSRYVESHDLHLRLEFVSVPLDIEVPKRSFDERSLVKRLTVKQHKGHPEYSDWINRELRTRFDYVCVESPDELEDHRFALTIGGQIKRENRYVKDDRSPIDDRVKWVLGDDNEAKLGHYENLLAQIKAELEQATSLTAELAEQTRRAQDLQRAKALLLGDSWESYDIASTEDEAKRAAAFRDTLKKGSVEIEQAASLRDDAQKRRDAADDAANEARFRIEEQQRKLEKLSEEIEQHTARKHRLPAAEKDQASRLLELFETASPSFSQSIEELYRVSTVVTKRIEQLRGDARNTEHDTRTGAERIMREYRQIWKLQAADLSESFEDREAYLGIYHRIRASGLPDYEQRFLHVLHDFSQDQITVIASTIRSAYREVKDKLIPVNRSLELSPYGPGTHLQIKAKNAKNIQVAEFLDSLQDIAQGTWDEQDIASAEERFHQTNAIIKRLKSSESVDVSWRKACLDTRKHVSFIANEMDSDGNVVDVHSSDTGLSGGQKQKLVIFCLAAALRYQLADEDRPIPRYGTVVLDEAFDKADPAFARTAMDIFGIFGFHMILATPYKLISVLQPYIGAVAAVSCRDSKRSSLTLVDFEDETGIEGEADDD